MEKKICFIISPIGKSNTSIRELADNFFNNVKQILKDDYKVIRADKISNDGDILKQIIRYIKFADIVLAYLADNNPNVYYELAIRHFTGKPVVLFKTKKQEIPFNIIHRRCFDDSQLHQLKKIINDTEREYYNSDNFYCDNPIIENFLQNLQNKTEVQDTFLKNIRYKKQIKKESILYITYIEYLLNLLKASNKNAAMDYIEEINNEIKLLKQRISII